MDLRAWICEYGFEMDTARCNCLVFLQAEQLISRRYTVTSLSLSLSLSLPSLVITHGLWHAKYPSFVTLTAPSRHQPPTKL